MQFLKFLLEATWTVARMYQKVCIFKRNGLV